MMDDFSPQRMDAPHAKKMFENNCHTHVCSTRVGTDNPLGFKCLYTKT